MKYLLLTLFFVCNVFGQETFEEEQEKLLDYSSIKNVLKSDGLEESKQKRQNLVKEIKKARKEIKEEKFSYPSGGDFWMLMSEFWLVKNAQLLSWDFPKPDYGIEVAFKNLLENLGYYNKSFKVLVINSPTIVHFGLPSKKDEYIFILSLPFMRSLDLTKVDLSLVLLEDFLRLEQQFFINNLDEDLSFLGKSFSTTSFDKKAIAKIQKKYTEIITKTGFNFQQQFEVTKKMDSLLKSNPSLWGAYYRMINKIDKFVKTDLLYQDYVKIYPSPELQLKWLAPKKKQL
ncbi:MAG: hypothetical protein CME62_10625 [Halobacteriovoraceae bacterium]|nr:hypothetical protein [Halobacteriovoraceae bacterium]|tara:strand:- start:166 stop:1026 length:861 start_codon:yes stop_codon:yes gene_type:complete